MLGIATVSTGTIGATHQSVRDMFKHAIAGRASAIIIGHNHPSNNCTPSSEDILFTRQVVAASKILGIPILDHVIVSSGITKSSYSFAYHGIIGGRDD
jgi:DNA repair protein RadC